MQKSTGSYEKVILTLAALVALAASVYMVILARGFDESLQLPSSTTRQEMNAPNTQGVTTAIATISKKYAWTSPVINGKPVPLNKSILLVKKDAEIYDLFMSDEKNQFRPPMTNIFVSGDKTKDPPEDALPHLFSANLGQLDADGDGFSNEDEFKAKTNPRDDKSLPPYTNKLFLKQRISNDYILKLKNGEDSGTFQIQRIKPEPSRSKFATVNVEFGFDPGVNRFVVQSFSKKKVNHPTLGEREVYVVKIKDNATNAEIELVQDEEKNLAEYEAQFEFRWKQVDVIPNVKKGKVFQLPRVGLSFKVLEIEESKAVISPLKDGVETGEKLEILQN